MSTNVVFSAAPRSDIQISLPDNRTFNAPKDTPVGTMLAAAYPDKKLELMAAHINGRLRELSNPITGDNTVVPVWSSDSDGSRIYRRTLSFLLIAAARHEFPEATIEIQHSMPFGGYYCERANGQPFTSEQLECLRTRMRQMVSADLPIVRAQVPLNDALEIFRASGDEEKAELFGNRRNNHLNLYQLGNVKDYFHGFMLPSTGALTIFDLRAYGSGFILQFPRRRDASLLQDFKDDPQLVNVFQTYKEWLKLIGVPSVNGLNRSVKAGRIKEVVLIAEALHQRQLSRIAREINARRHEIKIILISGPTSAGKTTFSKRLAVQLLARGIHPVAVGLDDYFVDRDITPRDESGDYDFEHVEAVDLPLFTTNLGKLLEGKAITRPHYNFITGSREWRGEMRLRDDQVLIIEGIHGLNPRLIEGIPESAVYRIYINAFTQLNLDKHNRIATTDTRKLRRMVRDFYHRGYNAADTIRRWPKVRNGEKTWIFPFQHKADASFNSALVYELAALKAHAEPILLQVEPGTPERVEANRLRAFLQWFDPIPRDQLDCIPNDSLLREFIGGSIMEDFQPWVE